MADSPFSDMNMSGNIKGFRKNAGPIIFGIIILVLIFSSIYTVGPEEVGVVLRFGRYTRTAESGLNFKMPFGIEEVQKLPVERQLKEEFGFRTLRADVQTRYSQENFEEESLMLTGDLNLAEVEWVVQYRINDPYKYLFKVKDPQQTLRDVSESTIRQVVGNRTVNEVLTIGRQAISTAAEARMQQLCNEYDTGIKIEQVVLQDVNPPDPVKSSFNAVNEAQQEKERLINEALADYNKFIPRAKGDAQAVIQEAQGYAIDRVNRAEGDVARFNSLYTQYIAAPEVTRKRIYLETMTKILPKIGQKIVIDENGKNVIPLLQMSDKTVSQLPAGGAQK